MKYFLTSLISIIVALIACKYFGVSDEKPIEKQTSVFAHKDFSNKLNSQFLSAAKKNENPAKNIKTENANTNAILAVIYKKNAMTWFVKAKGVNSKINKITPLFYKYFVDELTFENGTPNLSHIPKEYIALSQSTMRYASYMLDAVDISVTRLSGEQDTYANVSRWMKQVGLDDNSKIKMDFRDNSKTIIVRLPKD